MTAQEWNNMAVAMRIDLLDQLERRDPKITSGRDTEVLASAAFEHLHTKLQANIQQLRPQQSAVL